MVLYTNNVEYIHNIGIEILLKCYLLKKYWSMIRLVDLIQLRSTTKYIFLKKIYSLICYPLLILKGSYIGSGAKFISKPTFPHGITGIFVSGGAKIGKNCVIFHQVTIGSNTLKDSLKFGAPTIGDNVYIGAGAKIIGNVNIGNNVRIGANCVVVKDVPENATIISQPARVIIKDFQQSNNFNKLQV